MAAFGVPRIKIVQWGMTIVPKLCASITYASHSNLRFLRLNYLLGPKEGVINVNGLFVIMITPLYNGHII